MKYNQVALIQLIQSDFLLTFSKQQKTVLGVIGQFLTIFLSFSDYLRSPDTLSIKILYKQFF